MRELASKTDATFWGMCSHQVYMVEPKVYIVELSLHVGPSLHG